MITERKKLTEYSEEELLADVQEFQRHARVLRRLSMNSTWRVKSGVIIAANETTNPIETEIQVLHPDDALQIGNLLREMTIKRLSADLKRLREQIQEIQENLWAAPLPEPTTAEKRGTPHR